MSYAHDAVVPNVPGQRMVGTLCLREVTYQAGRTQRRHRHSDSSVSLVLAGELEETSPAMTHHAAAGSLVVKPADCWHADSYGPRGARVAQLVPKEGDGFSDGFRWTYQWHDAPRLARGIIALVSGRAAPEAVEMALWETLDRICPATDRRMGPAPAWWADAVDLLNACCDQPISVGSVARRVGVHPVHLARVCRRQFGCTVRQYIRQRRVLAAWRACERAESSLAAIAAHTGFADQAHMTRAFAEVLGVSPARLRRLIVN